MVAFSERPLCYQVGMLLLLLATSVFAAGLALPWWAQTRGRGSDVITSHSGLWVGCAAVAAAAASASEGTEGPAEEKCSTIDAPNWFKTVQALQCLSLAGMLVACLYAIFTNCCLDHATFSRFMELAAGAGGLLGMASSVMYVVKTSHILRLSPGASYSWAFAMDVAACVFVTLVATVLALTNSRHGDDPGSHFILEEGGGYIHQKRSGSRGKQREWEIEMTPMRSPKVPPASSGGSRSGVVVMQNNYCLQPQQKNPAGNGVKAGSSPAFPAGTEHACRPAWNNAGASRRDEPAAVSAADHGHCCSTPCASPPAHLPDCPSDRQTHGCSCTKLPAGPSPELHCNAPCDPKQFTSCHPLPPYAPCGCSGPNVTQPPHHEPQYYQQDTKDLVNEKLSDRDLVNYPRVEATAPPLSLQSEYADGVGFATTHYFGHVDTVCVEDEARSG
ncbi:hypothetical protein ACOMHN_046356 [Nucella lapillus]